MNNLLEIVKDQVGKIVRIPANSANVYWAP